MRPSPRRLVVSAVVAMLSAGVLAGCGASEPIDDTAAASDTEGVVNYPLTLENCGLSQTFDRAPARVVSLDQGSTEILLSLGLADKIVGTASWTDPVRDNLAEANADVPRLADNAPSYEAVLDTDPDLITASFGRHFKREGGVATRERFAETGIETYLSPTDCADGRSINAGGKRTRPLTMDALYQEITELAQIFDVPGRGARLVAELKQRTDAAVEKVRASGQTVGFWFADTRSPYFAGGTGSANLLATTVGLTNIFAEEADDWPAVSWEAVVDRNPDILVLGDLARTRFPGDRLDDKKDFLASDPVAGAMTAVQGKRYIALHGAELNPSIRAVDGIEKLVDGLAQLPPR
ncbi:MULTISPECIES: ABC transporter substrate-binding protein [unclassified Nocardia]|uniref:ABC transporter substrate-binding protein n=1 Tax=unclassified Nocardia TaxID=2637762 RepID=UPI00278C5FDE|nr:MULTISPECIES: ABC transporter substrate-binding protein [unclassified Nocardia]